jgi:hypothetical protein
MEPPSTGLATEPDQTVGLPLSPELVLISPELREFALREVRLPYERNGVKPQLDLLDLARDRAQDGPARAEAALEPPFLRAAAVAAVRSAVVAGRSSSSWPLRPSASRSRRRRQSRGSRSRWTEANPARRSSERGVQRESRNPLRQLPRRKGSAPLPCTAARCRYPAPASGPSTSATRRWSGTSARSRGKLSSG